VFGTIVVETARIILPSRVNGTKYCLLYNNFGFGQILSGNVVFRAGFYRRYWSSAVNSR
jgi:hypothetical protein